MTLKRGRGIHESDGQGRQFAAVVSESFVTRYWPNQDPIGRHFTFAFADREVVGVIGDVRFRGLERVSEPQVYLSSRQVPDGAITFYTPKALAVRTIGDPSALAPTVRGIIHRADPRLPITEVQTLTQLVDLETASRSVEWRACCRRLQSSPSCWRRSAFTACWSFAVSQRTQEIGVRTALGVAWRHCLDGMWMSGNAGGPGAVPGPILAYVAGRR